ncbi:MAG: hypothetical protein U0271_20715 [Polyangiaceae bacterium]
MTDGGDSESRRRPTAESGGQIGATSKVANARPQSSKDAPRETSAENVERFHFADEVALLAAQARHAQVAHRLVCDGCGRALRAATESDEPAIGTAADAASTEDQEDDVALGAGYYFRFRGGEVEVEDAPLCPTCATAIGVSMTRRDDLDDEEG